MNELIRVGLLRSIRLDQLLQLYPLEKIQDILLVVLRRQISEDMALHVVVHQLKIS